MWGDNSTVDTYTRGLLKRMQQAIFPTEPGVFAYPAEYEDHICLCDYRCPARYFNDAKGVAGAKNNIRWVFVKDPRRTCMDAERGYYSP